MVTVTGRGRPLSRSVIVRVLPAASVNRADAAVLPAMRAVAWPWHEAPLQRTVKRTRLWLIGFGARRRMRRAVVGAGVLVGGAAGAVGPDGVIGVVCSGVRALASAKASWPRWALA